MLPSNKKKIICTLMLCVALVLQASASLAFGQASSTSGTVGGTVSDQQGAVVAGATVMVRNIETGLERSAKTEDNGHFRVSLLPVGIYEIMVSAQGFTQLKQTGITLRVGDELDLKLQLSTAGATEVVNVSAEAPIADPGKTQVSTTINQKAIEELPINGRRWSNFVTLTPGVTPDGTFGLISFRGISGLLNNNTIDGADNNQAFFSEERGRTRINYVVSQEAIKEFQVNTQNYSPEFGRAAGGVVNAVSKSGTNDLHGSLFYFLRDETFNARNPLDFITVGFNANGSPIREAIRPADRRQQFGGTLGGPIKKDRAFWFFNYDQQKRNFPLNAQPSTLTFFTECTPGASAAACNQATNFIFPQTGVYDRRGDQWIFLPKLDWQITNNHLFAVSYNYMKWNSPNGIQTQPVVNTAESNNGSDLVRVDILNFRLVSTLSSSTLNEARFQYGRDIEAQVPNAPNSVGLNIGSSGAGNSSTGFNIGIAEFLPRGKFPDERKYQFVDNFVVSRGTHTFKLGADIIRTTDDIDNLRFGAGYYNYGFRSGRPAISNFALDLANPGQRNYSRYTQAFGPSGLEFRTWDLSFYVTDEWKARPDLTVNYGLRYEYIKMPDTVLPNPLVSQTTELPKDTNNVGPRVGFAWNIGSDRKTVLRAGYGIYYGRIINSAIFNALTATGAPGGVVTLDFNATNGPVFPNNFASRPTAGTAPRPAIFFFEDDLQAPLIHQADVVLERELTRDLSVSASYLLSRGRNLPFFFDRNLNPPNRQQEFAVLDASGGVAERVTIPVFSGTRPNPLFDRMIEQQSAVTSTYDALVLQVNKRLSKGIQFLAHYTLSRAEDLNQVSQTFSAAFPTASNPFDLSAESGRSNFHVRNRFVGSFLWELPFLKDSGNSAVTAVLGGWKLNGIVTLQSGRPVDANISGSLPSFRATDGTLVTPTSSGPRGSGGSLRAPFLDRNSFQLPNFYNVDLRLGKEFRFGEKYRLNFIAEAFNLFNRTHVFFVNQNAFDLVLTGCATPAAGPCVPSFRPRADHLTVTGAQSTLYRERQMQFALKFAF